MRGMYGLGALVALAAMLVAAPAAVAGETPCVGTLPPGTYKDIAVPAGQFCVLNDSQVRGNVTVPFQAFLSARRNTIRGDVKGVENNLTIFLFDRNRVMGNVSALDQSSIIITDSNRVPRQRRGPRAELTVRKPERPVEGAGRRWSASGGRCP